jgi:mRNA-degrading endonuclease RelE of RelBE toxin-antitoxin system
MIGNVDVSRSSFRNSYKKLPREIQDLVDNAIIDLIRSPIPVRYRFEKLAGYKNPGIYTIHITSNHSHKLSFELDGTTAILRKVATHKEIDKSA